ncbi:hypothetical protein BGZ81_006330 [Podila clonocystis]|nr:hypothetical protein BGZ81_006330 [Podila clonocystis]
MDTTPATPPPPPLARLPTEILDLIFSHLDQPTLAACVRVNRIWNELCIPRLWFALRINNAERLERFLTDEAQLALSRNVGHIRELVIMYISVCNIFAPFDTSSTTDTDDGSDEHHRHLNCTNLQKLDITLCLESEPAFAEPLDNEGEWQYLSPAVEKGIAAFIRRNPGLKTLELMDAMTPETLLPLLTHSLPNLEIVELSLTYAFPPCLAKILLENLPETIRGIQMTVTNTNDEGALIAAEKIRESLGVLAPRRHSALESLYLEGNLREPENYVVFLPFLESCTRHLEKYVISGLGWVRQPQVKEALTRLGVVPQSIGPNDLASRERAADHEIAEHLGLSAHWRQINLRHCFGTGPLAAAAIMDNGTHLQRLNVEGCDRISSKDLVLILEIVVPRPSRHEAGSSSNDSPAWEQCREIQRQVYRKLGEQKTLCLLGLGSSYFRPLTVDDPQYQRQCLEMTLESGLDELAGLTELVMLDVSNMDQGIGIPELEWMDRSWRRLLRINGMFMHCVNPVPGAREWIQKNRRCDWAYGAELHWLTQY